MMEVIRWPFESHDRGAHAKVVFTRESERRVVLLCVFDKVFLQRVAPASRAQATSAPRRIKQLVATARQRMQQWHRKTRHSPHRPAFPTHHHTFVHPCKTRRKRGRLPRNRPPQYAPGRAIDGAALRAATLNQGAPHSPVQTPTPSTRPARTCQPPTISPFVEPGGQRGRSSFSSAAMYASTSAFPGTS